MIDSARCPMRIGETKPFQFRIPRAASKVNVAGPNACGQ
jgi:hypothetical protein